MNQHVASENEHHNEHNRSFLLRFFGTADRFLNRLEEVTIVCGIYIITFMTIGNALSRSILNYSWIYVEEICQICLILTTFVGAAYAARKGRHIRMSALYDMMGEKARKVLIIIISIVSSCVMLYLAVIAVKYTQKAYSIHNVFPILRLPHYLVIMWIPFCLFLVGIEYGLTVYKNLSSKGVYLSSEVPDIYEVEQTSK